MSNLAEDYDDLPILSVLKDLQQPCDDWQREAILDNARHLLLRAARRRGKSLTAAERAMRDDRYIRGVLAPNSRWWIVGPSYDLAEKEFRYILAMTQRFCQIHKLSRPLFRSNPNAGDLFLHTPWGSEVIGKSGQKPEMLVGEELDGVIMSEPALHRKVTWERYVRPTLTTRNGVSIWPYTPDASGLWLYHLELQAENLPDWALYHSAAWDCPHYDKSEIEKARAELSEDAFYEQYGAEWRFYSGRVYKHVNPSSHEVEPFDIPKSWRIISATDFGYRDPTATIWLAKSPSGEVYLVAEYYEKERPLEQHCHAMLEMEAKLFRGHGKILHIADHHGLGAQLIQEARRYGWHTVACGSHDRLARRERALAATTKHAFRHPFHVREIQKQGNGVYPDLFVFKGRCPNLWEEWRFLRFKQTQRAEGSPNDTDGEDHAVDDVEYLCDYLKLGRVRREGRVYRPRTRPSRIPEVAPAPVAGQHTGYYSWRSHRASTKPN